MYQHYFSTEDGVFMCTDSSVFHGGDCTPGGQFSESAFGPELGIPTND